MFIVVCGFSVFWLLVFGFWSKILTGLVSDMVLGFFLYGSRFLLSLFNQSGNYAPPLISNNLCMLPCHHCIALIRILITRMWNISNLTVLHAVFGFDWIFFGFGVWMIFFSKVVRFLKDPKAPFVKGKCTFVRYINYLKIFVKLDLK